MLFWAKWPRNNNKCELCHLIVHDLPTKIVQFSWVQESSLILTIYWVLSASWHLIIEGIQWGILDTSWYLRFVFLPIPGYLGFLVFRRQHLGSSSWLLTSLVQLLHCTHVVILELLWLGGIRLLGFLAGQHFYSRQGFSSCGLVSSGHLGQVWTLTWSNLY